MPAKSKSQQRFFGMVRAAQKGDLKDPSSEVADVADDISVKDAKKFAKTKHKGLPEKKAVKEELTGEMKTDLEKYRVPRGPGGNPKRIGDKVRSFNDKQPLGQLKVKYGADKVREYYKKNKAVDESAVIAEGGSHKIDGTYDGKKISGTYLKLPRKVAKGVKRDTDERHELGKVKDAVTDTLGITNTKRDGVKKPKGVKGFFSMQNSYEPEGEIVEEASYKDFVKKAQDASSRVKKAKQAQKDANAKSAYKDRVTKGVRFYDKKGSGHIRDGKKVYS